MKLRVLYEDRKTSGMIIFKIIADSLAEKYHVLRPKPYIKRRSYSGEMSHTTTSFVPLGPLTPIGYNESDLDKQADRARYISRTPYRPKLIGSQEPNPWKMFGWIHLLPHKNSIVGHSYDADRTPFRQGGETKEEWDITDPDILDKVDEFFASIS